MAEETAMDFSISIVSGEGASSLNWEVKLKGLLEGLLEREIESVGALDTEAQLVFVDGGDKKIVSSLESFDRKGKALVLVAPEEDDIPRALEKGWVDDVLIYPFRTAEVLSKIRFFRQIMMWSEIDQLNASFQELIAKFQDDLKLAERLQKGRLPERFPDVKGLTVQSRYLAGLKGGGDYFDLAESESHKQVSLVLTHSSNYGLSSAVLSVLMRVSMKLAKEVAGSSYKTVKTIFDELLLTLGEKDELSVFYGVLSRKDLSFNFVNFGSSLLLRSSDGGEFEPFSGGPAAKMNSGLPVEKEESIFLKPKDRLILASEGFVSAGGGVETFVKAFNEKRGEDPKTLLNEMVFHVKKSFEDEDDMAEQDCTGIVLDVSNQLFEIGSRSK